MKPGILLIATLCAGLAACGSPPTSNQAAPANTAAPATAEPANGQAPAANAAESIKTRQTHYKQMGKAMKATNDELKKDAPAIAVIQEHAATINKFAPQIQGWFPDGSGAEAGVKTEARAEIWGKPDEFKKAAADLVTAAAQFNSIAQAGDLAAIRAGVKTLGGTCKACHDKFRLDD
jgi:cytochrome c556